MSHEEIYYTLALQKIDGVGDIVAKKLLQHCGNAESIFKEKPSNLSRIDGVGTILLKNLRDKSVFEKAQEELKFIEENDISVAFFQDENYPERLKHCIDSPILLFSSGNIDLNNRRIISIVGTRQITSYGTEF
jgi:DNA processing protein